MYQDKIGAYQRNDVLTADPKKLVTMCYTASITNLKVAKARLMDKQYEAKGKAIQKAMDIITELSAALNFEKGGTIAKNLDLLYQYMRHRILYAEVHRDLEAIDEVIGILEELGGAWKEVASGKKGLSEKLTQTFQDEVHSSASAA